MTILLTIRAAVIRRVPTVAVPTGVSGRRTVATIHRIELEPKTAARSRQLPADIGDQTRGIRPATGQLTASAQPRTAPSQTDLDGTPTVRPAPGYRGRERAPEVIVVIATGHRTTGCATT